MVFGVVSSFALNSLRKRWQVAFLKQYEFDELDKVYSKFDQFSK